MSESKNYAELHDEHIAWVKASIAEAVKTSKRADRIGTATAIVLGVAFILWGLFLATIAVFAVVWLWGNI